MKNFIENHNSRINGIILDEMEADNVASLNLKINATHSGRVNGNNVFYTPRSMETGVYTLVKPFTKHLQRGHNGTAIGEITAAQYVDISNKYPELQDIKERINTADSPKSLVQAVKELVKHKATQDDDYEGLGVAEVRATLYDKEFISELVSGENQGKVSIGGESDHVFCSICAEGITSRHRHKKGRYYNNELCFAIYDKMELDHVGFTNKPADKKTKTTILDNEESFDANVEIIKIQDNLEEKGQTHNMKLTYQELVEIAKSPKKLAKVFNFSEAKTTELEAQLTAIKPESEVSYLLPEKILATTDKLSVAAAKALVSQLDDEDPQKKMLQDLVNTQVELHFDGLSLDSYLEELGKEAEPAPKDPEVPPVEIPKGLTQEDFEAISSIVADKIIANLDSKQQVIQDSLIENEYSLLVARNRTLERECKALQEIQQGLTAEVRDGIISQILSLKGLTRDSEYHTEILAKRDANQLKSTLQDLSFDATPAVVKAEPEAPVLDKTSISDSLDNEKTVDPTKEPEKQPEDEGKQKIEDQQDLEGLTFAQVREIKGWNFSETAEYFRNKKSK